MSDDEVFHDNSDYHHVQNITIRVIMEGRVQKVGLRNWVKQKATSLGLNGWVRNRMNESVEALFHGPEDKVKVMVQLCHQGPSFAYIRKLKEFPQTGKENITTGFSVLPTV